MSVEVMEGNIFTTQCQTIVNTINCVGVMGAGIALECRLRYPAMFHRYVELCEQRKFSPGILWLYKGLPSAGDIDDRWILNFPTKVHWKYPSRMEWVLAGLDKFVAVYGEKGITSIAFPVLGGLNGGLNPDEVIAVMRDRLSMCDIPIEIYRYKADACDGLFDKFKQIFVTLTPEEIQRLTGMRRNSIQRIGEVLDRPDVCQLNQLAKIEGIGIKTLEKTFALVRQHVAVQGRLPL